MSLGPYKGKYCLQIREVVSIVYGGGGICKIFSFKTTYKECLNHV